MLYAILVLNQWLVTKPPYNVKIDSEIRIKFPKTGDGFLESKEKSSNYKGKEFKQI